MSTTGAKFYINHTRTINSRDVKGDAVESYHPAVFDLLFAYLQRQVAATNPNPNPALVALLPPTQGGWASGVDVTLSPLNIIDESGNFMSMSINRVKASLTRALWTNGGNAQISQHDPSSLVRQDPRNVNTADSDYAGPYNRRPSMALIVPKPHSLPGGDRSQSVFADDSFDGSRYAYKPTVRTAVEGGKGYRVSSEFVDPFPGILSGVAGLGVTFDVAPAIWGQVYNDFRASLNTATIALAHFLQLSYQIEITLNVTQKPDGTWPKMWAVVPRVWGTVQPDFEYGGGAIAGAGAEATSVWFGRGATNAPSSTNVRGGVALEFSRLLNSGTGTNAASLVSLPTIGGTSFTVTAKSDYTKSWLGGVDGPQLADGLSISATPFAASNSPS